MMWTVALPPENNPVLDDHALGDITIAILALTAAGNTWGFGRRWSESPLARKFPVLR